jgi:microcystin-dependent protein
MALTKQQLLDLIVLNLADQSTITASEHRALENAIVDAIFTDKSLIGDIKEIAVPQSYIAANFEPSSNVQFEGRALPGSERYGWAICNGKNGTVDKRGNVSIGYDPVNYPLLTLSGANGAVGGEKNVTLQEPQMPIHNHGYTGRNGTGFPDGSADSVATNWVEGDPNWYRTYVRNTKIENKGGGQSHNNMQPYIVTLFIQKIS